MDSMSFICLFLYALLRIEPSASHVQDKHSATKPQPQPQNDILIYGFRTFKVGKMNSKQG